MWWGGRRLCILGGRDVVPEVSSYRLVRYKGSGRRGIDYIWIAFLSFDQCELDFPGKTGVYLLVLRRDHPILAQLH